MIRNLKVLGLALVAMFAISAMTASAASAVDHFTNTLGAANPALMTGTSHDNVFRIISANSKFECTTSKFTATALNGSTEATVLAGYTSIINETPHNALEPKCNATIGKVLIDMNDCHYILTGNTTKEHPKASGKFDAAIWIKCPKVNEVEQEITITGPLGCVIHVPSQTPTEGGVVYTNLPPHPGGAAVKVTATVTGITYKATNCIGFHAEDDDAEYNGTVTVTGYEDKNATTTELTKVTEGLQVGISTR
jgi:hypothetical protein